MGGQVFAFSFAKKPHYCAKSSLTNGKKKATYTVNFEIRTILCPQLQYDLGTSVKS